MYRCPECKYDQAKDLFSRGQLLMPGNTHLHVAAETSSRKRAYEERLVQAGALFPNDVSRPHSSTSAEGLEAAPGGDQEASSNGQNSGPSPWDTLTTAEKEEHQQRVAKALDDVLDDAIEIAGIEVSDMADGSKDLFVEFSRLVLRNSVLSYEVVRECDADIEEFPFGQVLAGYRPALEDALDAWKETVQSYMDGGPGAAQYNPLDMFTALFVPVQQAIDRRMSDDVFVAIQNRIHSDTP